MRSTSVGFRSVLAVLVSVALAWSFAAEAQARARSFSAAGTQAHGGVAGRPPVATIDQPATDVQIFTGESVTFAATWQDPDGGLGVMTFSWSFPPCAQVPSAGVEDPGPVQFNCAPDDYVVTFEVCDSDGLCGSDARTITIASDNAAPQVAIDDPPAGVTVLANDPVEFRSTAADPDGPPPLSFAWTFPPCASPSSSIAEDPGPVTFASRTGTTRCCSRRATARAPALARASAIELTSNFSPVSSIDAPWRT